MVGGGVLPRRIPFPAGGQRRDRRGGPRTLLSRAFLSLALGLFLASFPGGACPAAAGAPTIQFHGAAQMVGGSSFLLDTGKTRVLIDCGLFYGTDQASRNAAFPFDPASIQYVLLTHAHTDHAGRIPLLYRQGFRGKVVGTDATRSLLGIMLEMGMKIAGDEGAPLYGFPEYAQTMEQYQAVSYDVSRDLTPDLAVCFREAGHILGSAFIEIRVRRNGKTVKLVVASDMGASATPLLREPAIVEDADYVLIESTYGGVRRGPVDFSAFGREIGRALAAGGSVLIPAFVLEKTQKVLYVLGALVRRGGLPGNAPVYVDSATARAVNAVYRKYRQYYDEEATAVLEAGGDPLSFPSLREVSAAEALQAHDAGAPAVFVSSSGMLEHANAPKHLARMIEDPRNLLVLVGWQAPGSLGRKILDGARRVDIPLEEYRNGALERTFVQRPVKMRVRFFGEFSSHADGCQLLTWLSRLSRVRKVFVVHGDKRNAARLAAEIRKRLGFPSVAPALGERFPLGEADPSLPLRKARSLCAGLDAAKGLGGVSDQ